MFYLTFPAAIFLGLEEYKLNHLWTFVNLVIYL